MWSRVIHPTSFEADSSVAHVLAFEKLIVDLLLEDLLLMGLLSVLLVLLALVLLVALQHELALLGSSLKVLALELLSIHKARELFQSEGADYTVAVALKISENRLKRIKAPLETLDLIRV